MPKNLPVFMLVVFAILCGLLVYLEPGPSASDSTALESRVEAESVAGESGPELHAALAEPEIAPVDRTRSAVPTLEKAEPVPPASPASQEKVASGSITAGLAVEVALRE